MPMPDQPTEQLTDEEVLAALPLVAGCEWKRAQGYLRLSGDRSAKSNMEHDARIDAHATIALCRLLAEARRENERVRGDLAVAVDIFHDAGSTRSWHSEWDDDVAELLGKHWPT